MGAVGIIAEFNPLHIGHKRLIDFAKENGDRCICVISGNFVQRGDIALISKQKRAELALKCGADVVAEMPTVWSMSTAQNFALAGVFELYNLGADTVAFGSECGDISLLENTADILLSDDFSALVSSKIKSGITFAVARNQAACELGVREDILIEPNNNLGIEYIIAAKKLKLPLRFKTLKRVGEGHNSKVESGLCVSSSVIREKAVSGDIAFAERFMPTFLHGALCEDDIADIMRIERTLLGILRTKTKEDFESLPDLSEGIENKLYFSVRVAKSLDELYNMIKSKRYPLSRVRRLVLSAAIGADKKFFMATPPYIRILGLSKDGETHMKTSVSAVPVISKVSLIKDLDGYSKEVFDCECLATDLYALSFKKPHECGEEYKYKFLKTEMLE